MKISELRAKAKRELGPKFDLREYNDAVLEYWIGAVGRAGTAHRRVDRLRGRLSSHSRGWMRAAPGHCRHSEP